MSAPGVNAPSMPVFAHELTRVTRLEEAYKKAGFKNTLKSALGHTRMWTNSLVPWDACRLPTHR